MNYNSQNNGKFTQYSMLRFCPHLSKQLNMEPLSRLPLLTLLKGKKNMKLKE